MDDAHFDVFIRDGLLIDGTADASGTVSSVGIRGDKIVYIGPNPEEFSADQIIDATGLVICPGFVDTHTHDDCGLLHEGGAMTPKVTQGITTVVVGNCGISVSPLFLPSSLELVPPLPLLSLDRDYWRFSTSKEYVHELTQHPATVNVSFLIGHSTLRLDAMQDAKAIIERPANGQEMDHMRKRLQESMEAGSIGLSTGLAYAPNNPAPTEEVISLAKVASNHGGLYATHMRDEGAGIQSSVEETLTICEQADIQTVISHFKSSSRPNWGKVQSMFKIIDEFKYSDRVMVDVYPYTAASTILTERQVLGAEKTIVAWSQPFPELSGRDANELAKERNQSIAEMVTEISPAGAIYFSMCDDDVEAVIKYKKSMIGSDGLFFDRLPHPRLYGSFPRVLGYYGREKQLLKLPLLIHKMTQLPAQTFKLAGRGIVQVGNFADIVIFDATTVEDAATFTEPKTLSKGIHTVFTNGKLVYNKGVITPARPGRVLRREN